MREAHCATKLRKPVDLPTLSSTWAKILSSLSLSRKAGVACSSPLLATEGGRILFRNEQKHAHGVLVGVCARVH